MMVVRVYSLEQKCFHFNDIFVTAKEVVILKVTKLLSTFPFQNLMVLLHSLYFSIEISYLIISWYCVALLILRLHQPVCKQ